MSYSVNTLAAQVGQAIFGRKKEDNLPLPPPPFLNEETSSLDVSIEDAGYIEDDYIIDNHGDAPFGLGIPEQNMDNTPDIERPQRPNLIKRVLGKDDDMRLYVFNLEDKLKELTEELNKLKMHKIFVPPVETKTHSWVKCPEFGPDFIPKCSLSTPQGLKLVDLMFSKTKFTGQPGYLSLTVIDFLQAMNKAQKRCLLSEEDFLDVISSRVGPPASNMVNRWIELKYNSRSIYNRLYQMFNSNLDPIKSQALLMSYKIPSNFGFNAVLMELDMLASQASLMANDDVQRKTLQETYALTGLQKCLPIEAARHIEEIVVKHIKNFGTQPKLEDLTESLLIMSSLLDSEIKNARNFDFDPPRKLGMFPHSNIIDTESIIPTTYDMQKSYNEHANTSSSGFNHRVNTLQSQPENEYSEPRPQENSHSAQKGEFFCDLCSMDNHTCDGPNGCYLIMDDNFKQVINCPVSDDHCLTCKQKLDIDIYHPEIFCPLRKVMLAAYRSGKIKPMGPYAQYLREQQHM
jgi:hypothetical protein